MSTSLGYPFRRCDVQDMMDDLFAGYGTASYAVEPLGDSSTLTGRATLPSGDGDLLTLTLHFGEEEGSAAPCRTRFTLFNATTGEELGRQGWYLLTFAVLDDLLAAWTLPGTRAQRWRRMVAATRSIEPADEWEAVLSPSNLLYREDHGGSMWPGDDGLMKHAGYVEPYPSAWPRQLLRDLIQSPDDLSALWPFLDEAFLAEVSA